MTGVQTCALPIYLTEWFADPQSQHLIAALKEAGVNMDSQAAPVGDKLAGITFVLTGELSACSRNNYKGPCRN